jgi:hypothetical protein
MRLNKVFFVVISWIIFSSSAIAADWRELRPEVLIDISTMEILSNGYISYWERSVMSYDDFNSSVLKSKSTYDNYSHQLINVEVNCRNKMYRHVSNYSYAKSGAVLFSEPNINSSMQKVIPESNAEWDLNFACGLMKTDTGAPPKKTKS